MTKREIKLWHNIKNQDLRIVSNLSLQDCSSLSLVIKKLGDAQKAQDWEATVEALDDIIEMEELGTPLFNRFSRRV